MSVASTQPISVGTTLAHFRVLEKLGEGGMGQVYRAEDTRLKRLVALKVLPPERSAEPDRQARLLREARAAAVLSHPNIAVVYEVDESDGRAYIAMELVAGRSLRQRLDGPPKTSMAVPEVLALVRQIAAGLACAHQAGVVHRDLKPDNVMVDPSGRVKLLDFGLAKLGAPSTGSDEQSTVSTVTEEGRVMGTPGYMSPEQARGAGVDARTDVFAVGVLLYELLTGVRPFSGASPIDVLAAITRDAPRPPSQIAPSVPRALEALVLRCLEKDPARRPADGGALEAELDALEVRPLPRRRVRWPLLFAAAPLLVVPFLFWRQRAVPSRESAATPMYHAALEALRRAETVRAGRSLEEALHLDPELAAASLRVALNGTVLAAQREQLARAEARRDSLDEHDRALLDAIHPCVADRDWSWSVCAAQLQAASARWPDDEELTFEHARALANLGLHDQARARALQAGSPRGLALAASEIVLAGDAAAGRRDAERCVEASPLGIGCFLALMLADEQLGDCATLETDAHRFVRADTGAAPSWLALARAQVAEGRPIEMVRASLSERWKRISDGRRGEVQLSDELQLLLYQGDFTRAAATAAQLDDELSSWPLETEHLRLALHRVQLESEMGRDAEAAEVAVAAEADRARRGHAPGNNLAALSTDATPLLFEAQLRGGRLKRAEAARRRDDWLAEVGKRLPPAWAPYLWIFGYAAAARTPEEALEAMAALPRFQPLPPRAIAALGDAEVGRVHLLADRAADAIPLLARAVGSCRALELPVETVRAQLALAEARAATGDEKGACAGYAKVLERWGAARPSSRTAETARTRARALGCR
jgi:eukaryotic-like serine/threonine-protein kinase